MKKERKRRQQELLGMSQSTADKKLRKAIILEMARQLGKNVCLECGRPIEDPEDLAIKHVEDWEGDPSQFFDLTNVAFGHASCGAGGHGKRQGEESKMRVEISVEDANGNRLPGAAHEGQLYVAAKKGERYQVRVRNRTGKRLLVVTTVDGRNVQTGEPGDVHDSGHVLQPHQSWVFKGWRTSDDEVAAFTFGKKKDSYSSQMGSKENVGVIGVAVFEEKEPDPKIITVKEREYVPYPVYPSPWRRPWYEPTWTVFSSTTNVVPASSSVSVSSDTYELNASDLQMSSLTISSSVDSSPATSGSSARARSSNSKRKLSARQELGTEFGEALNSSVVATNFVRATEDPCEVHTIRYDSREALRRRGVRVGSGRRKPQPEPRAFPESPGAEGAYCKPPPRRRAYKG